MEAISSKSSNKLWYTTFDSHFTCKEMPLQNQEVSLQYLYCLPVWVSLFHGQCSSTAWLPGITLSGSPMINPSTSMGRSSLGHRHPVETTSCGSTIITSSLTFCKIPTTLTELPSLMYLSSSKSECKNKDRNWGRSVATEDYPSWRHSERASAETFLSANHFWKSDDRTLHLLDVLISLLSTIKDITLESGPAFTRAWMPDLRSVM